MPNAGVIIARLAFPVTGPSTSDDFPANARARKPSGWGTNQVESLWQQFLNSVNFFWRVG
jgi:hypothetical protein